MIFVYSNSSPFLLKSKMEVLERLMQLGRNLGLEGEELQRFTTEESRKIETREREERAARREEEAARREAEKAHETARREAEKAQNELEKLKIESDTTICSQV